MQTWNRGVFWYWVNERQRIYHRRFVEDQDPPWTEDPILGSKHFTNCYRHLDHQTQWFDENRVGRGDLRDVFINSLTFTVFNRKEVLDEMGWFTVDSWDPEEMLDKIDLLDRQFNSAYMTTGISLIEDPDSKAENYLYGCIDHTIENIGHYWDDHFGPGNEGLTEPDELTDIWTEIGGISDFLAYEIYCDMCLDKRFPWTENDYVNPGPGAIRGINRIYGRNFQFDGSVSDLTAEEKQSRLERNHKDIDYYQEMRDLRQERMQHLDLSVHPNGGDDFSLRSVEHSLCEFDKYMRAWNAMIDGSSVGLRSFSPDSESESDMRTVEQKNKQDTFGSF